MRLTGTRKTYGDVVAVDRVDLDIAEDEFFTLLGPSGSGKTTCLRMIAGFERPDEGSVELAGRDVTDVPPYERDVNTVFQDYALFPHMTVGENVEYGLRIAKVGREELPIVNVVGVLVILLSIIPVYLANKLSQDPVGAPAAAGARA